MDYGWTFVGELPRTSLPRTPVNRGKKKGRGAVAPAPTLDASCVDGPLRAGDRRHGQVVVVEALKG
jgi:hypothetical protein